MPTTISRSPNLSPSSIFPRDPPAERLGIDVWQLIFEACCEGNKSKEEAEHIPFTLASVSRRWRMVALKTSLIWTTIFFQGFTPSTRTFRRTFTCLRYSRLRRLVVHVDMRREGYDLLPPGEEDPEIYDQISHRMEWMEELLKHHAWRVRELSFISDTYKPIDVFLQYLEGHRFVNLEFIDIRRANPIYVKIDDFEPASLLRFREPCPISDFGRAHSVKFLDLLGVHLNWGKVMVHNLTRLTLGYLADEVKPTLEELYGLLLTNCGTLEYLDLQGILEVAEYYSIGIQGHGAQVEGQDAASGEQRGTSAGTDSSTAEEQRQRAWKNMLTGWVKEGPTDYPLIDFSNLRELRLGFLGTHEGVVALSLIRAPKLRHLTLTDIHYALWPVDEQPWGRSTRRCHDLLVYICLRRIFYPDALPLRLLESLRFEGIYPTPGLATTFLTNCDRLQSLSVISSAKALINAGLARNSFSSTKQPSTFLKRLHVHTKSVCTFNSTSYIAKLEMEQAKRGFVPLETPAIDYGRFTDCGNYPGCCSIPHPLNEQAARDMFGGQNIAKQVVLRRVPLEEGGPPICPRHEVALGWKSEPAL